MCNAARTQVDCDTARRAAMPGRTSGAALRRGGGPAMITSSSSDAAASAAASLHAVAVAVERLAGHGSGRGAGRTEGGGGRGGGRDYSERMHEPVLCNDVHPDATPAPAPGASADDAAELMCVSQGSPSGSRLSTGPSSSSAGCLCDARAGLIAKEASGSGPHLNTLSPLLVLNTTCAGTPTPSGAS